MKFTFIISLLFVTGTTLWLSSSNFLMKTPSEQSPAAHTLQSYLEDGVHTHFSETGSIIALLKVDRAVKYLDQHEAHLEDIEYQSKINQGSTWHIQATSGQYLEEAN